MYGVLKLMKIVANMSLRSNNHMKTISTISGKHLLKLALLFILLPVFTLPLCASETKPKTETESKKAVIFGGGLYVEGGISYESPKILFLGGGADLFIGGKFNDHHYLSLLSHFSLEPSDRLLTVMLGIYYRLYFSKNPRSFFTSISLMYSLPIGGGIILDVGYRFHRHIAIKLSFIADMSGAMESFGSGVRASLGLEFLAY